MKRPAILGAALFLIAAALWHLHRARVPAAATPRAEVPAAVVGGVMSTPPGSEPAVPNKVRKISRAQREQLAAAITRARTVESTAAPTTHAASSPSSYGSDDVTIVKTTIRDAMRQAIPFLAACYDAEGSAAPKRIKVVATLTLIGDPAVGTVIDTQRLGDEREAPLQPSFDTCLRDVFASLAIPPLSESGQVEVTYPFVFAASEQDAGGE